MLKSEKMWGVSLIALVIGAVLGAGILWLALGAGGESAANAPQTIQELYAEAVKDAAVAEEDEILPLVTLEPGAELVTWDESGKRVQLCTWHNYPDSYPEGEYVTIEWGEVWTFAPDELKSRLAQEKQSGTDSVLRLSQLIGMPPEDPKSTFTVFWVDLDDIVRPAAQTDPTKGDMVTKLEETEGEFKDWYDGNILWSYYDSAYPWTRLGYTYDWADNGTEYGLTEFLVLPGSQVEVISTQSTQEFLDGLDR